MMGQAKQRGTKEQRIEQAIKRNEESQRKRQEYFEMRQKEMREERQEKSSKQVMTSGRTRNISAAQIAAITLGLGMITYDE
jgi:Flp pilus assembly protein TadB